MSWCRKHFTLAITLFISNFLAYSVEGELKPKSQLFFCSWIFSKYPCDKKSGNVLILPERLWIWEFSVNRHMYILESMACYLFVSEFAQLWHVASRTWTLFCWAETGKLTVPRREINQKEEVHTFTRWAMRKTGKSVRRWHLRLHGKVWAIFQMICCYSKDNKEASIQWDPSFDGCIISRDCLWFNILK